MALNCNCLNKNNSSCSQNGTTGGYAFILVLFILIVLVGAAWIN